MVPANLSNGMQSFEFNKFCKAFFLKNPLDIELTYLSFLI